ncbi:MAG: hypothetical protein HY519_02165 [Candidatus Aenigmarchaeota archaeon]|nr:hypothetical protein [Candidatus Aenigmarchaeota archaeon]
MRPPAIRRIIRENKRYTDMLEYYDRTGKLPLAKVRRSFTLRTMNIEALKSAAKATDKSMSGLLDELIEKHLGEVDRKVKKSR